MKKLVPLALLIYPFYNFVLWIVVINRYAEKNHAEQQAIFKNYTVFSSYAGFLSVILSVLAFAFLLIYQDQWLEQNKISWTTLAVLSLFCLVVHGWSML